jgi:UDP-N-acetylglucosamine/UDP-N-acetylgalactosamine diphosphorylase
VLKVDGELDQVVVAKTYEAEQQHVFRFWAQLDESQQRRLLDQLAAVDFQQLHKLVQLIDIKAKAGEELKPIPPTTYEPARRAELAELGWKALADGRVACLVVAGGQGTRLGWPAPKGTYPVGPVSEKSLFALFAEQLCATGERAGKPVDLYVLCSRLNREQTEGFFRDHGFFGLNPQHVTFLVQGELPNTDPRGKLLLSSPSEVALSPNGHGGTFKALQAAALQTMAERGQDYLFYWQVDNPLCRVADPVFLGAHIAEEVEASTKTVKKVDSTEKVGVLAYRNGRVGVAEYSELSDDMQEAREEGGDLLYRAGNTAIHIFSRSFLDRLGESEFQLEHHLARKAVPCIDEQGKPLVPDEPNAIKFETFIFDLLAEAKGHLAFEVVREEEFEPLKNKSGPYSAKTVKRALSERAARWIEAAGHEVERDADGKAVLTYEVSSLTALDPESLKAKLSGLPEPTNGTLSL